MQPGSNLVFLDRACTRADVRRMAEAAGAGPWYAVAVSSAAETRQAVIELGGRLIACLGDAPRDDVRLALKTLVDEFISDHGADEFEPRFDGTAARFMQDFSQRVRHAVPDAGVHVTWSRTPLAPCVAAESGLGSLRADPWAESPAALALRTGLTLEQTSPTRRELAIPMGEWPGVPGSRWAVCVRSVGANPSADALQHLALRCVLDALTPGLPSAASQTSDPSRDLFRRTAVAARERSARALPELPLDWSATLRRTAFGLAALVLLSPLLLLWPVERSIRCEASVVAAHRHDVIAPFAGRVVRVGGVAGQPLHNGDALFRLFARSSDADAERAIRSHLDQVAARLLDPSATATREFRAAFRESGRSLQGLAGTVLRAPIDGVLADVVDVDGRAVAEGERIATVLPGRAELLLTIRVPAQHAARVVPGAKVLVASTDGSFARGEASIIAVATSADTTQAPADAGLAYVTATAAFEAGSTIARTPGTPVVADVTLGRDNLFGLLTHGSGDRS